MSKRKNPVGTDNLNGDFCDILMELAEYEKIIKNNTKVYDAYRKAAVVLSSYTKRVESGDEAKKLKFIGPKISCIIDDYLQNGKVPKLEKIRQEEENQAIITLSRVFGIGRVKATELAESGIKTVDDLRNNKTVELNNQQILGLKYFEDFKKKIPRQEIQQIETKLRELIKNVDPEFSVTICGSYRRGKQECGDIDVLLVHPSVKVTEKKKKKDSDEYHLLEKLVVSLDSLIIDTLSIGPTKFLGVCRLSSDLPARRLDILLIPPEQYHCALLSFTGSDLFNKTMRLHAKNQKYTLNEYWLCPLGARAKPVPISAEEEIFKIIDFPYKKPEERVI